MEKRSKLPKKLYDLLTFICTQLSFDFVVIPFIVNRVSIFLEIWSRLYYYALLATILGLLIFSTGLVGFVTKIKAIQPASRKQLDAQIYITKALRERVDIFTALRSFLIYSLG
jgi:hypothetical protein